jgi:GcrA cell cycle regulator
MSLTYSETQQHNALHTPWSAERDEALKQLWAQGYSASLIADKLANGHKLTRCAVIGRAHRLKLPARRDKQPHKRKPYRANGGVPKPPRPRPQPTPPPQPPRPTPSMKPKMRKLPLLELGPHQCRWPLGELMDVAHLFCGADKEGNRSYCPAHHRMAHPPERRGLPAIPKDYPRAW